jgi:hypothetical protein
VRDLLVDRLRAFPRAGVVPNGRIGVASWGRPYLASIVRATSWGLLFQPAIICSTLTLYNGVDSVGRACWPIAEPPKAMKVTPPAIIKISACAAMAALLCVRHFLSPLLWQRFSRIQSSSASPTPTGFFYNGFKKE